MSGTVERKGLHKALPFAPEYRAPGLLLHVTSLPSAYGIGDLGPEAFAWIDRLHAAGQSYWQALLWGRRVAETRHISHCHYSQGMR
ncbi:MAG TPA: 4-alpha-glucanotransferase [Bryobacteraceae bacterium]|nr:4-alpha-glucanotransferase [Bryobacteraceae bacterium]